MLAGCGPGNPLGRLPLSGEITLDGQPIVLGSIQFEPTEEASEVGTGGLIDNGHFAIDKQHGLPPGRYLVRIYYPEPQPSADEELAPPGPESITGPPEFTPARELIPARYNVESELTIEVSADEEQSFNFTLTSD